MDKEIMKELVALRSEVETLRPLRPKKGFCRPHNYDNEFTYSCDTCNVIGDTKYYSDKCPNCDTPWEPEATPPGLSDKVLRFAQAYYLYCFPNQFGENGERRYFHLNLELTQQEADLIESFGNA